MQELGHVADGMTVDEAREMTRDLLYAREPVQAAETMKPSLPVEGNPGGTPMRSSARYSTRESAATPEAHAKVDKQMDEAFARNLANKKARRSAQTLK